MVSSKGALNLVPVPARYGHSGDAVACPGGCGDVPPGVRRGGVLGVDRTAGSFVDEHTARVILNVTSSAAAETALREGVQTRLVERSTAQLRKVRAHLEHTARIAGTGWATDPVHDKIAVSADATVSGARLDQLEKALKPLGEAVALTRVAGSYTSASRRGSRKRPGPGLSPPAPVRRPRAPLLCTAETPSTTKAGTLRAPWGSTYAATAIPTSTSS